MLVGESGDPYPLEEVESLPMLRSSNRHATYILLQGVTDQIFAPNCTYSP
jgi:hypothetical protein